MTKNEAKALIDTGYRGRKSNEVLVLCALIDASTLCEENEDRELESEEKPEVCCPYCGSVMELQDPSLSYNSSLTKRWRWLCTSCGSCSPDSETPENAWEIASRRVPSKCEEQVKELLRGIVACKWQWWGDVKEVVQDLLAEIDKESQHA